MPIDTAATTDKRLPDRNVRARRSEARIRATALKDDGAKTRSNIKPNEETIVALRGDDCSDMKGCMKRPSLM